MQGKTGRISLLLPALFTAFLAGRDASADESQPILSNDEPATITTGAGAIGERVGTRDAAAAFILELRAGPDLQFLHVRPSVGLMATAERSLYGWLGLNLDLFLGNRFVLTPQFGVGAYSSGSGQDLGHVLEFRSGAVMAWRFENWSRLGVGVHHLSNTNIGDRNPGTETLGLFYSHPFAMPKTKN